ncbi:membrane protein PM19L-like [Elaeis guineensis]|uniref:Membrane protein PM19L-like n=1 Tax=Elaeis guineensis var. tenera TaxID=51953 RepID=A0A6I9RUC4_ELAGV|nr:membrane protein PM19L-like [Elaeis guineensis]
MATGTAGRGFLRPLLFINFIMYITILGLAGWSLDKLIDGESHRHLGGRNTSTGYLVIFSLMTGAVGACSVLAGLLHTRAWRSDSLASAISSALVSWALTALSFGLACKHINLGNRGRHLRTLEAFIIILTFTQLLYLILLHAGIISSRYGPGYRNYGTDYGAMSHEAQKDSTTTEPPDA